MDHHYAQMMENSLRIERMERRGQLLASLGPRPAPYAIRMFGRTVTPLAGEVIVHHVVHATNCAAATRFESQAA